MNGMNSRVCASCGGLLKLYGRGAYFEVSVYCEGCIKYTYHLHILKDNLITKYGAFTIEVFESLNRVHCILGQ